MNESELSDIRNQFTAQVDRFVASPHVNEPEPIARYVAVTAPRGDERAVDVGCGPGLLAKAFAPHVRGFLGIDLTHAMVRKAGEVARAAGLANARFAVGDALALPLRDACADLVLTRLALHHMPRPGAAIAEMARVCAPGGRLAIFDMTTSEIDDEARYHDEVEILRDPSHARALPISELAREAGRAGLEARTLDTIDYTIDVDDWIARAEQSAEEAAEARRRIEAAIGTRKFGGKKVWREEEKLKFTVRWAILVAGRPG